MHSTFFAEVKRFIFDEEGAAAVEYGLMAALIAVVIALAVTALGSRLCFQFNKVVTAIGGTAASCPNP